MRGFEYASPTTKEQAVALLGSSWADAEVLAGGTDLLSLMKDDIVHPKRLVNIKAIPELRGIKATRGGYNIGATTTVQELLDHAGFSNQYPAITKAAQEITSPQIRAMGTVGGDICQRPRCWYYRAGYGLLGRDASGENLVTTGDNRYHAILGNAGPAYFVNPSSLAPALIAYGAKLVIHGPKGGREVEAEKFFVTPKTADEREYDLKPGEIVTSIVLPLPFNTRSATYEVRQREALDWPLATASVALKMAAGKITGARIVLGHVAPVPWRATAAEQALVGKVVNQETAKAAGDAATTGAKALSKNGYKVQLARVAVKRALLAAAGGGSKR
jgi:xanthine dehydrogenase YagS FAD-binding subunit